MALLRFGAPGRFEPPVPELQVVDVSGFAPPPRLGPGMLTVDASSGAIQVGTIAGLTREPKSWRPLADGEPVLKDSKPIAAKTRGGVVALATQDAKMPRGAVGVLRLFGGEGKTLAEYPVPARGSGFQLSHDGRWLARDAGKTGVEVRPTSGGAPTLVAPPGRFHNQVEVVLGDQWLAIEVPARLVHMVRWDSEQLLLYPISYRPGNPTTLDTVVRRELSGVSVREPGQRATRWRLPEWVQADPGRFVAAAQAEVVAVTDRYGQVSLFDRERNLVAMAFVWRKEIALWMPDGSRLGSPRLLGGPPTPDGRRAFAKALQAATARGRVRA
jgi:hypothetical protein